VSENKITAKAQLLMKILLLRDRGKITLNESEELIRLIETSEREAISASIRQLFVGSCV
jgi:hypothetical protein